MSAIVYMRDMNVNNACRIYLINTNIGSNKCIFHNWIVIQINTL